MQNFEIYEKYVHLNQTAGIGRNPGPKGVQFDSDSFNLINLREQVYILP